MTRYFINFRFNGAKYHGWQVQQNANSVQQTLNHCLSLILNEPVYCIGCGRTDAGVHAKFFTAHFDLINEINDYSHFEFKMQSLLPHDIGLLQLNKVKADAHARFDATERSYEYRIMRKKNPFEQGLATYYYGQLDMDAMKKALQYLNGEKDYGCFSKTHTQVKTNICNIFAVSLEEIENDIILKITADRFLRNMVRAITGTLIEIGRGIKTPEDMNEIINRKERSLAGFSVPAEGLYLSEVKYPEDIYLEKNLLYQGKI